jgi:Cof subfamily protein (haloacid dehalogenase superfamily)
VPQIHNHKRVKIIFFDLDDTLLNSNELIGVNTNEAIHKCSRKGIRIGYITARSLRKTGILIAGLPCDCIACYNGAIIKVKNEVIRDYVIPYDKGVELIKSVKNAMPGVSISAHLEPFCFIKNEVRNILTQEVINQDLFHLPPHDFQRIRIVPDNHGLEFLSNYHSDDMLFTYSAHGSVVITNRNACKKNAVNVLKDYFHLDKEEILSFGDDFSDIGMFEASGTSVAMANAVQELKNIADYVTLSNDEEGIAAYLNEYILKDNNF